MKKKVRMMIFHMVLLVRQVSWIFLLSHLDQILPVMLQLAEIEKTCR